MTLHGRSPASASAQRAVELVAALEHLDATLDASLDTATTTSGDALRHDDALAAIRSVLVRWDDRPDDLLDQEIEQVLAVIAEISLLVAITDTAIAAQAINELFGRFAGAPRLVHEPDWGWHVHVDRSDSGWAGWLAASTAMGCADLLSRRDRVPWGRCADPDCGRPFVDHGRRAPQRYCSDTCATRERVRRHRTTRRSPPAHDVARAT